MNNNLYIMHYGVGHDKGGHSGRYPWGSGENPYGGKKKFIVGKGIFTGFNKHEARKANEKLKEGNHTYILYNPRLDGKRVAADIYDYMKDNNYTMKDLYNLGKKNSNIKNEKEFIGFVDNAIGEHIMEIDKNKRNAEKFLKEYDGKELFDKGGKINIRNGFSAEAVLFVRNFKDYLLASLTSTSDPDEMRAIIFDKVSEYYNGDDAF